VNRVDGDAFGARSRALPFMSPSRPHLTIAEYHA
jgi:hypothetical protein